MSIEILFNIIIMNIEILFNIIIMNIVTILTIIIILTYNYINILTISKAAISKYHFNKFKVKRSFKIAAFILYSCSRIHFLGQAN